jgi:exopolyphosphatase/guanosine-5'-triphosphate,3'-diphosphate pyrophosphatase
VERARLAAAAMRVAFPISVAMDGVLPRAPIRLRDGDITLELPREMAALASERLLNRLRMLARVAGHGSRIEVTDRLDEALRA